MSTSWPYNQAGVVYGPGWMGDSGEWLGYNFTPEIHFRITVSGGASPNLTLAYRSVSAFTIRLTVNGSTSTVTSDDSNTPQQLPVASALANGVYDITIKRLGGDGAFWIPLTNTLTLSAGTGVISAAPGYGAYKGFADVAQADGVAGGTYFLFVRSVEWGIKRNLYSVDCGFSIGFDATISAFAQDNCIRLRGAFTRLTPYVFTSSGNPSGVSVAVDDVFNSWQVQTNAADEYNSIEFTGFTGGTKGYEFNFSGAPNFMGFFYDGTLDIAAEIALPTHDVVGYMDSITYGLAGKNISATSLGYQLSLYIRQQGYDNRFFNLGHNSMTVGQDGVGGNNNSVLTAANINRLNLTSDTPAGLLDRAPDLMVVAPTCANDHFNGSSAADVQLRMGQLVVSVLTRYVDLLMVVGDMLIGGSYSDGVDDTALRTAVENAFTTQLASYPSRLAFAEMLDTPLGADADWSDGSAGGPTGGGTGVHPSFVGVQLYLPTIQVSAMSLLSPAPSGNALLGEGFF